MNDNPTSNTNSKSDGFHHGSTLTVFAFGCCTEISKTCDVKIPDDQFAICPFSKILAKLLSGKHRRARSHSMQNLKTRWAYFMK